MPNSTTISSNTITFTDDLGNVIGKIKAQRYNNHSIMNNASVLSFEGSTPEEGLAVSQVYEPPQTVSYSGGVLDIDMSLAGTFHVPLNGGLSTITLSGATAGQSANIILQHTVTAGYTVSWQLAGGSIVWASGSQPQLSGTQGEYDIVTVSCLSSTTAVLTFLSTTATGSTSESYDVYTGAVPTASSDTEFVISAIDGSSTAKLYINSVETPDLQLVRGNTYTFNLEYESNLHNVFGVSRTDGGTHNGGYPYTEGMSFQGVRGASGGSITFVVPDSAPDVLYYYDDRRAGAGGTIFVISPLPEPVSQTDLVFGYALQDQWEINGVILSQQPYVVSRFFTYTFSLAQPSTVGKTLTVLGNASSNNTLSVFIDAASPDIIGLYVDSQLVGNLQVVPQHSNTSTITVDVTAPTLDTSGVISVVPRYSDTTLLEKVMAKQAVSDSGVVSVDLTGVDLTTSGYRQVTIRATDAAQNVTAVQHSLTLAVDFVVKDTTGPSINTTNTPSTFAAGQYALYEINDLLVAGTSASDANGTTAVTVTQNDGWPSVAGIYSATLSVTDAAGNVTTKQHQYTIT